MVELMLRAVIVGAFASAAALLFEKGLTHLRLGTRYAWTFALLGTTVLPFVPRMLNRAPAVMPEFTMPVFVLEASSAATSQFDVDPAQSIWILLSALVLLAYAVAFIRLQRARTQWRAAVIAQEDVLLSKDFGPAVFGFVTPRIVVPEWVQRASDEEQRLILLHEREHMRARDQLQLLLTLAATAIMPWNPFVWLQARRLRFTMEADCDQRVLATEPDARRYATLLVDVGSKQTGLMLTPALAEYRNGLERRLNMLAMRIIRNRWKAATLVAVGLVLTVMACESRLPSEPQQPMPRNATGERSMERKQEGTPPPRPEAGALIEKYYPPLLREAGIGGVVGVEVTVHTDGTADNYRIVKSSGHDALDQAALRVVKEMEMLPRRVPAGQQPKDEVRGVFLYFNAKKPAATVPDTAIVLPAMKDVDDEPQFTPYTEKPELQNRDEVGRLLVRNYPPLLRDADVGGTALVWTLINESGVVTNVKLKQTSGHDAIDVAAMKVAQELRFTPARNRGQPVKVWVQMPIVFKTQ